MTDKPLPQKQPQAALEPPNFRTFRTIAALMLREMGSTYGRSPGGYLWAVLQPIGMIVVLSIGFSLVIRAPSLGTSFALFYATGYLPFSFFATTEGKIRTALRYSAPLLAYPGVTWIDTILARFFLNLITAGMVFCLVITGILVLFETRTILDLGAVLNGVMICVLVGLGAGLCNAVMAGLFPLWGQLWEIVSRPLFLASGVFFLYEDMPPLAQSILWWNPMLHGTGLVRTGFYPTYRAEYVSSFYCYAVALALIALGLIFLRAMHKTILER